MCATFALDSGSDTHGNRLVSAGLKTCSRVTRSGRVKAGFTQASRKPNEVPCGYPHRLCECASLASVRSLQRFRGLAFKAHRLVSHSRVIKKKKEPATRHSKTFSNMVDVKGIQEAARGPVGNPPPVARVRLLGQRAQPATHHSEAFGDMIDARLQLCI